MSKCNYGWVIFVLTIAFSPAAFSVVQCEQPGNPDGVNLVDPPVDLPIRYEEQMLKPDEFVEYMDYGFTTAMSGSWLAVSAELYPSTLKGFVDLYQLKDGAWSKVKTWTGPQQSPGDVFNWTGLRIALENDLLVIADANALGKDGVVYVYQQDKGGANQWGLLSTIPGSVTGGRFGISAEIDNRKLVIGSQEGSTPDGLSKGVIYVFNPDQEPPEAWTQQAKLEIPDNYSPKTRLDRIHFSGNHLMGTVREELSVPNTVLAWEKNQDNWAFSEEISFSDSCELRYVVIDGDTAVVNMRPANVPSEEQLSALVFFERDQDGHWERKFELDTTVNLGSLALQGDRLIAAAIDLEVVGFVFDRQHGSSDWRFAEKLTSRENLPSPNSNVAFSDDRVAIQASRFHPEGVQYVGTVFTYSLASFSINPRLNDAWVFDDVPRQGFLFTVLPQSKLIFLAWFTFDTERPNASVTANLGEPGHRWLTALGPFDGTKALLDIEVTSGGIFDSDAILPGQAYDGTIELEFADCRSGTFTYDIPSLGLSRTVAISRAVDENVAKCEAWNQ
jgi:hypothetical protein